MSIFATNISNNEEPIIFGDGDQTRDYIFVKDVVSALVKSSKLDILNIGTGRNISK